MNFLNRHSITRTARPAPYYALALFALAAATAQATPIAVPNGSFENPTTPTEGDGAPIPSWVFNVQGGYLYGTAPISQNFTSEGAASGSNYAFLFNDSAGITDTITSAASLAIIQPNMSYTLSVAVGNVAGSDSVSNHFPGKVSFSLLANGTAFATQIVPNGTVPDGTFEAFSLTFQTPGSGAIIGENLEIQLASLPTPGPGTGPAFDNVTLNATSLALAPEPSTGALLLGGLLTLGWFMRRRIRWSGIMAGGASLALAMTFAHAVPISIPNASFESPATPVSSSTNLNLIPGWVFGTNNQGFIFGTEAISKYFTSTEGSSGSNFVFMDNYHTEYKETITSAAPLTTIQPLTTYTLSVAVGNVKGADTSIYTAPGNVTLSLLANGTSIATEEVGNGTVANGTWEDFTLTYTSPEIGAVIGENLTIQLASLAQTTWAYEPAFDNVTLDAVPEPSTGALLISGALALGWVTRRSASKFI